MLPIKKILKKILKQLSLIKLKFDKLFLNQGKDLHNILKRIKKMIILLKSFKIRKKNILILYKFYFFYLNLSLIKAKQKQIKI